jgi:hypothetical protein
VRPAGQSPATYRARDTPRPAAAVWRTRGSPDEPGYDPGTYSAGLIEFIAAFVSGHSDMTAGDLRSWASDLIGLGPGYFFSLNRYLFLGVKN